MGQTLSEPVTDKHSAEGENENLAYGVSEMQGWRLTMEDAHATILSLDTDGMPAAKGKTAGSAGTPPRQSPAFFAVYDGHGGSTVARFAGDTVHHRLRATEPYQARQWSQALKRAFLGTDEDLRANSDFANDPSGCTAVATLITPDRKIYCANSGDSRSVLSVGGEAKPMSYDHKPVNKGENSRIVAAGGFVEFGRVNGNLALSRALGDFEFKQNHGLPPEQQIVTADPDIIVHEPTDEDEFLILACDGIWDVVTSQQAVDYIRRGIADRVELPTLCERLMERCLAPDSDWGGVGCDNMTMMVVALLNGRTKSEWYDWVAERVEKGVGYKTPASIPNPFSKGGGAGGGGGGPGRGGAPTGGIGRGSLAGVLAGSGSSLASRIVGGNVGGDDDDELGDGRSDPPRAAAAPGSGAAGGADEMDLDDGSDDGDDDAAAAFQAEARRDAAHAKSSKTQDDAAPTPANSSRTDGPSHSSIKEEGLFDKSEDIIRNITQ